MAASPPSLHMSSAEMIRKEPLDHGGFGDVYLCLHPTFGQVVMKTIYTGILRSEERKKLLIDESSIMASLSHERVVKLLGVIMEDGDCSLVMELIPRGNLLVMLAEVTVPLSVKGRIILEILEAMVYLSEKRIIHKDIKPENILIDSDFHIKIADLGLAVSQAWTKLTKEESRRRSHRGPSVGVRGAGTLSYMAPEHLESINAASTEKSDVYSFAIVVWVILTSAEPYQNARSEDQICQCVRKGDRPAEDLIPQDTPQQLIDLMKQCWDHNPHRRPTFKEGYNFFLPFYMEKLEPSIEEDLLNLRNEYEGPEELVEKMKSLSLRDYDCSLGDIPAPLLSSDSAPVPVEASIEDLHNIQAPQQYIQSDAVAGPLDLEEKLNQELHYHRHGNYTTNSSTHSTNGYLNSSPSPFPCRYNTVLEPGHMSSVHSFTKAEPVHPTSQARPASHLYTYNPTADQSLPGTSKTPLSSSCSAPFLSQLNQEHPDSLFDRQHSWPTFPATDTSAPEISLAPSKSRVQQDSGSLYIQNAKGIQIGNNNQMSIASCDSCSLSSSPCDASIFRDIQRYEGCLVTEAHLDILRENIGKNWKICARRLGLTNINIQTIEHDFARDGLLEMVYQMLESWRMKEGSFGCTIPKLVPALEGIVNGEIIRKILDTCGLST